MSADAVLYDHPGPRARARNRILTVVFGLAALALAYWIYRKFDEKGQWAAALWKPFTESSTWTDYILPGLWATLSAAAVAMGNCSHVTIHVENANAIAATTLASTE